MFLDTVVGSLIEPVSGRRWDRAAFHGQVQRRMAKYAGLGLRPGDAVFLHNGNSVEFFADLSAAWLLGACVVPIDPWLTAPEIETLARSAQPRLAVASDPPDPNIVAGLSGLGIEIVVGSAFERTDAAPVPPARTELSLDQPALILFTSGTTGDPKGVVHTHRSLRARWVALRASLGLARYRKTLCLLPTHFGHGLICNCLFPWLSGADLFIVPPFRPDIVVSLGSLIDEHEITFLSSVPAVWRLALKTARPPKRGTLERVFCGSAQLSASLWRSIQDWAGTREVWNAYGITETGSWVAGTSLPDLVPEDGLVGEGWGAVLKVLRSAKTEPMPPLDESCEPGEPGHVWINTPALMQGYFRRDDLTRQVVSHGWFLTGDIGLLDDRGRLYLRGREREEINKGGMKVYPADVDAVFETLEGVIDACTFGYQGDPLYGENVGIAIVLSEPTDDRLRLIHRAVEQRLRSHRMPARWYVVEAIPRTSRGKVNRSRVAEVCAGLEPVDWPRILRSTS